MEAKDTVMSDDRICEESIDYMQKCDALKVPPDAVAEMRKVAQAQAEISFKAGEKQGIRKAVNHLKYHYLIDPPEEMIKEIEDEG